MHSACPRCCIRSPAGRWSRTCSTPRARSSPRALVRGRRPRRRRASAQALAAPDLAFVTQDPPRGTGDAVARRAGRAARRRRHRRRERRLPAGARGRRSRAIAERAAAGHARAADRAGRRPGGARPHRPRRDGRVRAIVEERDADAARARDRRDQHRRAGGADRAAARAGSRALRADNAQREYYLTDIVAHGGAPTACRSSAHLAADERDVLGVNDRAQLAAIERIVQRAARAGAAGAGTSIADPGAHRPPRHARLRPRRAHRRRLRVRGRRRARRRRERSAPYCVLRT